MKFTVFKLSDSGDFCVIMTENDTPPPVRISGASPIASALNDFGSWEEWVQNLNHMHGFFSGRNNPYRQALFLIMCTVFKMGIKYGATIKEEGKGEKVVV